MSNYYDLWDLDTGTSLGTYETEAAALTVTRELITAIGPHYAEVLDLGHQDAEGGWTSIASGADLLELVEPAQGQQAPSVVGQG